MVLPGTVDPLTGQTAYDPLTAPNPSSPDAASMAPAPDQAPAPYDVSSLVGASQPGGLTGADAYNTQRLTRAWTYLKSAVPAYPDLVAAVGLAPTSWQSMDAQISALGGTPGTGSGLGQLMNMLVTSGTPKVNVADIKTIKQTLMKEGFLPPNTPLDGSWDSNTSAAVVAWDDYQYNRNAAGDKVGGVSLIQQPNAQNQGSGPGQFLHYLSNVLPSQVGTALVGAAKFLFGGIAHTVERTGIRAAGEPQQLLTGGLGNQAPDYSKMPLSSFVLDKSGRPAIDPNTMQPILQPGVTAPTSGDVPAVAATLQAHGLKSGSAAGTEDLSTLLTLLPFLKGAGTLAAGLGDAATQFGEQGLLTPAADASAKGVVASSVRALTAKAAAGVGTDGLLNAYATSPMSLQSLGEAFLNRADQIAAFKSTGVGTAIQATIDAATQTSLSERAAGAIQGGTIAPNVKIGGPGQSALSKAITDTPTLGSSWAIGPIGTGRPLGNPLDLSALIWAPEKSLPTDLIKASPTLGEMADSMGRITPTAKIQDTLAVLGMSRQQLVDALGSEPAMEQAVRYWSAQASMFNEATTALRSAGINPSDPGFEAAMREKVGTISANLKADPMALEKAISSATPDMLLHQVQYMFKDYPGLLARRGQAGPILQNWSEATTALRNVTADDASVNTFARGGKIWTTANQQELNDALGSIFPKEGAQPLMHDEFGNPILASPTPGATLEASKYAYAQKVQGRLAQTLDPEAVIGVRRIDNALGSANDLSSWKITWDRIRSVQDSLATRIGEATDTLKIPKGAQVSDLRNAGFADDQINAMRNPDRVGLTEAQMTVQQARQLYDSLSGRVNDLRNGMNKYYPETAKMLDDRAVSRYAGNLAEQAPRDVTLHTGELDAAGNPIPDQKMMDYLAQRGYQPIALHRNALTLNHTDPQGIAAGLESGDQVSPVIDHVGVGKAKPSEKAIQTIRQNLQTAALGDVAKRTGAAADGKELSRILDDALDQKSQPWSQGGRRTEIPSPFASKADKTQSLLYASPRKLDYRSLTQRDLEKYANLTPDQAYQTRVAVRSAAAFGFDVARPIATMRGLGEALRYNGIPGMEDAIRTIVGLKGKLPDFVQGPAGHILNLPDDLTKVRDFIQFQMNPQFAAAKAFKSKILRGMADLPFDLRPKATIQRLAQESGDEAGFKQAFVANYHNIVGNKANAYGQLLEHPDFGISNPNSGVFGWTNTDGEALDAWRLAQQLRQEKSIPSYTDLAPAQNEAIAKKLQSIYGYADRSGLEKTANYIFFPLSFDLKVARAMSTWMLQSPARILMTTLGLQMWNQDINSGNKIGGFVDKYLPVLPELNRMNIFAHGLGGTISPLGGRNTIIANMAKDVAAIISANPRAAAYVPVSASDQDLPNTLSILASLTPMFREMQTASKAVHDQIANVAVPATHKLAGAVTGTPSLAIPGAQQWQVDNYYQETDALKREVSIILGNSGLKPSFSTLTDTTGAPNPAVNQQFYNTVMARMGEIEAKYPAGAAFAKAYTLDNQGRTTELEELFRKPVKTRAEASMLYFAAAYYSLSAQANAFAGKRAMSSRALKASYHAVAGAEAAGNIPPSAPGSLDDGQVATLRSLAQQLNQSDPNFGNLYNKMFKSELGPLTVYGGPAEGAAA